MTDFIQHLDEDDREQANEQAMPDWLAPMLAKLTHDHFADDAWVYERKLDGERILAYVDTQGQVKLCSRNKKCLNTSYPELVEALQQQAPRGAIFDGEVVALNAEGVSDFQQLQGRMNVSSEEEARNSDVRVYYYLFDCLYLDGHNLTKCSLRGRKKLLRSALQWDDPLRFTAHRNGDGINYYKEACERGWEGLIAKLASSRYVHSRSPHWLKFKCLMQQEFVICGFTAPSGERIGFGALLLGFYRDDKLVYAGDVGTGFDDETLTRLHEKLQSLSRKTSPYDENSPTGEAITFVRPELVCEVAFSEWTADDKLRHPRFQGLRRDKHATDVHKEDTEQVADL
ncbi:non-homologous end-joining DNA ligase [Pseudidiomarina terrestris]|uniref:DNA ligase (ATP) n=1 Tax=Pseudidiomarina terrestris TaxID=2820060 RepID=A0AAW7R0C9_9GAMM|nr:MULTISPECIES: non-homologous end-joining DNA ligase [unclassified Pseudidiomarina]MDN7125474.1 non-homologous end-joining DNA ligase [Pseudidiomarina sp. 1APP75-32.1]MDN7128095.1 non-homologous end-joining DNA ligase [Pseudidiomarina sp. 1APR75-33.1]MDN7130232.1 non-homologous end-joining DNA ligase [Pseudidiomarina sp. 1APR75-15]MDN7135741.1 non-homologous end-joining DNA ligase [Pseudidiomarina sp. 1ASP75-5]